MTNWCAPHCGQTTGLPVLSWFGFGYGWVGWERFACRATSPSGCRVTSEPYSFIQSCFKEIFGGGRGDAYTFSYMTSNFPLLRRPNFVIVPPWVALSCLWWCIDSWLASKSTTDCSVLSSFSTFALQRLWLPQLFFPGLSDAEDDRVEGALAISLIIGLDFAVTLSSPDSFCVLFDITSAHSAELKWLMFNKNKRWFHSSRVKFPLVSMSANWFLVSIYLIWILESKLIRSNNQSSATLWVLETCLIVLLLPFIIILITASLSSNTYSKASWFENLSKTLITFRDWWRTWLFHSKQLVSPFCHGSELFPRNETIRPHKSRAGIPSKPQSCI